MSQITNKSPEKPFDPYTESFQRINRELDQFFTETMNHLKQKYGD